MPSSEHIRGQGFRDLLDRCGFPLGVAVIGFFFAAFAPHVERIGAEQPGDPGPTFLPAALGWGLVLGAAWLAWQGFRAKGVAKASIEEPTAHPDGVRHMARLVGGMLVYMLLLPILGFSIATFVGGALLLCSLQTRWWLSIVASAAMVLFAKGLFTWGFDVQLPEGALDNWLTF